MKNPGWSLKKILWSIDAFETSADVEAPIARTLDLISSKTGAQVVPAYVFSPAELEVPLEFSPDWLHRFDPSIRKALDHRIKETPIKNIGKPEVVVHERASLSGSTRALASKARTMGADLIAVSTHSRRGISRLVLGSFAESLLFQATVPVLVAGPHVKVNAPFENVLFSTDFEESSFEAFEYAVALARSLGCKLEIFHAMANPVEPVFQSGVYLLGGGWVPVPVFFKEHEERLRKTADAWKDRARESGVPIDIHFETGVSSVVESVLQRAQSLPNSVIAMAAQSGRVASALLGSVTREVIRSSEKPVFVLRSRSTE